MMRYDEIPSRVPIFPLPEHVFLPDLPTPYRVFEPRYVQLVQDLLERPESERWLAIPRLAPGWEQDYEGSPGFFPIATVGRLLAANLDNRGHYRVIVRGRYRVRLREISSDRLYRLANIEPCPDAGDAQAPDARAAYSTVIQLFSALEPHLDGDEIEAIGQAFDDVPDPSTGVLRLGSIFVPDPDLRQKLLESPEPLERAAVVQEALATVLAAVLGTANASSAPS